MPYPPYDPDQSRVRRRWHLRGQVQGVGLRPFVYRLAQACRVCGFVRNDSAGVTIEAEGTAAQIEGFSRALLAEQPALARFDSVTSQPVPALGGDSGFVIQASSPDAPPSSQVTVDTAVCDQCLAELNDPTDRRFGYGLINCTNCGPRYSIIRRVPYDRPNTTMVLFEMCQRCRSEYTDPTDRRFHAQPIACHECGPRLELVDPKGKALPGDPIDESVDRLVRGQIVAIKGLGGFHFAIRCDDEQAVSRLRRLKHRDAKPFAVMCASVEQARGLAHLSDRAIQLMNGPQCPVVLATRRKDAAIAPAVAPQNHRVGVMLPYTPIQHLLFTRASGRFGSLVMTSANPTDAPLVIDNQEAVARLGDMCDAILWHDRPIQRPVDDSVWIDMGAGDPLPVRRARGYAPGALPLPYPSDLPGVCLGGELKNTVAVVRNGEAILSQHLGELTHPLTLDHFKKTIGDLCDLFGVKPRWIACDLHPLYLSTAHAKALAPKLGCPLVEVQHHHAHAAAVMAEHGITGPTLCVVCDGVGYGTDGTSWGGELLWVDGASFERLARLRPLVLPGGDAAAKDTRRSALALLHLALGDDFGEHPAARSLVHDPRERQVFTTMIQRRVNGSLSSSAGRVLDGMASLLGLCHYNQFEAQAGLALEACASQVPPEAIENRPWFEIRDDPLTPGLRQIDFSPLVLRLLDAKCLGVPLPYLAALIHEQMALAWAGAAGEAAAGTGIDGVALSGGVFCNQRITERLTTHLLRRGLRVFRHRQVPPNDGGLSLGQAAVATQRLAMGSCCRSTTP